MAEERIQFEFEDPEEAGGWTGISNWVITAPNLSDGAIRLYAVLKMFAFRRSKESWPSQKTIQEKIHKKERAVKMLTKELKEIGLIETRRREHKEPGQSSLVYRFKKITPEVLLKLGHEPGSPLPFETDSTNKNKVQKSAPEEFEGQNFAPGNQVEGQKFAPNEFEGQNFAQQIEDEGAENPGKSSTPTIGSGSEEYINKKEEEKKKKKEKKEKTVAQSAPASSLSENEMIEEVWNHWLKTFEGFYTWAELTDQRKKKIKARLNNFKKYPAGPVVALKTAIDAVRRSDWHIQNNHFYIEKIFSSRERAEQWVNKGAAMDKKIKPLGGRPGNEKPNKDVQDNNTIDREKLKAERLAKKREQQAKQQGEQQGNGLLPEYQAALEKIEKMAESEGSPHIKEGLARLKEMEKRMNGLTA